MAKLWQHPILTHGAAVLVIAAVALLPLAHTGQAVANAPGDATVDACCTDACLGCDSVAVVDDSSCCDSESEPDAPAPCEDGPCDCPCCGKVLQSVSMIPPLLAPGLFWATTPTPTQTPHLVCPDSAVVRVDIQPPIA